MIRFPVRALPPELQSMLDERQASIDAIPDYAVRVETAGRAWDSRPRERFQRIRDVLTEMCSGEDRCMYCEDSASDEIEHFRPKSLYPERTFDWHNYLFSCGICNGRRWKGTRFAVLSSKSRQCVEMKRTRGVPVVAPDAARTEMLIDPRREDPMRFMILNLVFPFHFHPLRARGCVARARAAYTIEVLGVNRDPLPRRRELAYGNYLHWLQGYVTEIDLAARKRRRDAIQRLDHPTVWREMQRQHPRIPELHRLFEQAPEALDW